MHSIDVFFQYNVAMFCVLSKSMFEKKFTLVFVIYPDFFLTYSQGNIFSHVMQRSQQNGMGVINQCTRRILLRQRYRPPDRADLFKPRTTVRNRMILNCKS